MFTMASPSLILSVGVRCMRRQKSSVEVHMLDQKWIVGKLVHMGAPMRLGYYY